MARVLVVLGGAVPAVVGCRISGIAITSNSKSGSNSPTPTWICLILAKATPIRARTSEENAAAILLPRLSPSAARSIRRMKMLDIQKRCVRLMLFIVGVLALSMTG
jgi:hypothetical protein